MKNRASRPLSTRRTTGWSSAISGCRVHFVYEGEVEMLNAGFLKSFINERAMPIWPQLSAQLIPWRWPVR